MNVLIKVVNYWDKIGFSIKADYQENSLAIRKREPPFEDEYQITVGSEEDGKSLNLKKEELQKLGNLINDLLNEKL